MDTLKENLKYQLKAVILDFKFDGLTQDDLIYVIGFFEGKKLEKIDSVLISGIHKAISTIELNGLKEGKQWKNSKKTFHWTYSNQHNGKAVLIERLRECLEAIAQDKIQVDDICDILAEKEIDSNPEKEFQYWKDKMDDCFNLYQMIKSAIIQYKNRTSLTWSFPHTKDLYARQDLYPVGGTDMFKIGYETFKHFKREQLRWGAKRSFDVLQVEALIRLFNTKKLSEITKADVSRMIKDLKDSGYSVDYPPKKHRK